MGPLPNATNGHKLLKHFSHCPIPSLQHQNPSCHTVANLLETPRTYMLFYPLHFQNRLAQTSDLQTRWTTRKIKHVCNLHVYNVQFKNFIYDFGFDYDIYFWHSYGNSRIYLLFRSYYIILDLIFMTFILLFRSYYIILDLISIFYFTFMWYLPHVCLVSAPAVLSHI